MRRRSRLRCFLRGTHRANELASLEQTGMRDSPPKTLPVVPTPFSAREECRRYGDYLDSTNVALVVFIALPYLDWLSDYHLNPSLHETTRFSNGDEAAANRRGAGRTRILGSKTARLVHACRRGNR